MTQTTVRRKYSHVTFKISVEDNVFMEGDIIQNDRNLEMMKIRFVPAGRGGYVVWRNYPYHVISHELCGKVGDIIRKVG